MPKAPVLEKANKQPTCAEDADEDVWEEVPEKRLRFVDVLSEIPNGDASNATELCLPGRGFTDIDSLESCRSLKKLELRDNYVAELDFLEMSHELCWLGLAKNRLERISGLNNLSYLAVLDLSDNRIARLEGLSGLAGLKALIAARNHISKVEGLSPKKNPLLETLVLSHNRISECNLAPFPGLKKVSMAHNKLHAFPGMATLPQLMELRLNGNSITALSRDIARQPKLSILDVGNNLLQSVESLEPLRGLLWLKSFNFFGNSIASDVEKEPLQALMASLPALEILNNRRRAEAGEKNAKKKHRGRRKNNSWNDSSQEVTNFPSRAVGKTMRKSDKSLEFSHTKSKVKRIVSPDGTVSKRIVRSDGIVWKFENTKTPKKTKKRKTLADMSSRTESVTSVIACEKDAPAKRKKKIAKKRSQ